MIGKKEQPQEKKKRKIPMNDYLYELYLDDIALREDLSGEIEKRKYMKEIKNEKMQGE